MINGEGPSVPIITLAGVQSLTDLLLEFPLPTPLPGVTGHQSLLSHLRNSEEVHNLLNTQETILIPSLIDALGHTSTDHIEVKDGYYGSGSYSGQISQLMQYLLGKNSDLFKGSDNEPQNVNQDDHISSGQWLQRQCSNVSLHSQKPAFNASAVLSGQPLRNSFNYYPLDPPTPEAVGIVQNKTLNVAPESPSIYSTYTHSVVPSDQQQSDSPLHQSVITQGTADSLSPDLQESSQIFNSFHLNQHTLNVSQSSPAAVHSFSNGNCIDEVDLTTVSANQCDRTENQIHGGQLNFNA